MFKALLIALYLVALFNEIPPVTNTYFSFKPLKF